LIPAAAGLLPLACSGGSGDDRDGGTSSDEARIVPEGLTVTALPGGNGVLDVIALTLAEGERGAQLYAALKNDGDVPACDAALAVELFDRAGQSLGSGISGAFTRHLHRLTDGSGTLAACVDPGDVSMAAITDVPVDRIDDIETIVYRCPYFALDVVPVDGLAIEELERVTRGETTVYAGTLVNELDIAVSNPSVTVFAVNGVGRPLGVATARNLDELPAGGRSTFETSPIDAPGVDQVAYPAGSFAH